MYPSFGGIGPYGSLGLCGAQVPYGSISLTQTSPPQISQEPMTVAEVKNFLNLPESWADEDTLIAFIVAARVVAEIAQGRDLIVKQWDLSFDYWRYRLELRSPIISVDLVQYRNSDGNYTTLTADVDYILDSAKQPAGLTPPFGKNWPTFTPWPSSAILVRFTSGIRKPNAFWSNTGATVKLGMRQLISGWFNNRIPFGAKLEEMPYGVTSLLGWGAIPRAR